jgi:hypothetical protein
MTVRQITLAACLMVSQAALSTLSFAQSNEALPTMSHAEVQAYRGEAISLAAYAASNGVTYQVGDVLKLSSPDDMVNHRVGKKTGLTYFLHIQRTAFFVSRPASHEFLGPTLTVEAINLYPVGDRKRGEERPMLPVLLSSKGKRTLFIDVERSLENNEFTLLAGPEAE